MGFRWCPRVARMRWSRKRPGIFRRVNTNEHVSEGRNREVEGAYFRSPARRTACVTFVPLPNMGLPYQETTLWN
jgi:hypothetical protein